MRLILFSQKNRAKRRGRSDVRLERRARRRHERRAPGGRQVGRRRARVARRPAVLVEVLGAAHRVAPLDAALRHAVLALQLGGAPGARLAPPHHVPLALLQLARPLALAERLGALRPLGAAVERLGAQHAVAVQRAGALELGALGPVAGPLCAVVREALDALVVVGQRVAAGRLRPRVDVLLVVAARLLGRGAVLLLGVVGGRRRGGGRARRPGARVGLVGGGGGGAQPGRLQLVGARAAPGAGGRRAAAGLALVAFVTLVALVGALVGVRDAAVVQRRRVVQRAQLLVERARERGHQVSGSYDNDRNEVGSAGGQRSVRSGLGLGRSDSGDVRE